MHHLYPSLKGDHLCPLGFHPQTRYPTRCKRCFRDYKEHGSKRGIEEVASSSPNLSNSLNLRLVPKSWTSTQNLMINSSTDSKEIEHKQRPISWTSTPAINESNGIPTDDMPDSENSISVTVKLPNQNRRHTTNLDLNQVEDHLKCASNAEKWKNNDIQIQSCDTLAERVRKMTLIKKQNKLQVENQGRILSKSCHLENKVKNFEKETGYLQASQKENNKNCYSMELQEIKCTAPTDKLKNENDILKRELEKSKLRMERLEREKSDILLKRISQMDKIPNRTAAAEALELQKKVNELRETIENLEQENKELESKLKHFESNPKILEKELNTKLKAAEQICEELIEENKQAKREIINLQTEMEELQDTFREDEAKHSITLRKELEKVTKNCRILSFKLKKYERKINTLEMQSQNPTLNEMAIKIKKLEDELRISNDVTKTYQMEIESLRNAHKGKLSAGHIGRNMKGEIQNVTSMQQMQRDFAERESDLKEQLRFAEEEGNTLRKKLARLEDENENFLIQMRKMKNRRIRENEHLFCDKKFYNSHLQNKDSNENDLGFLLELNDQEANEMRHRLEELESKNKELESNIKKLREVVLPEKINSYEKIIKNLKSELSELKETENKNNLVIEKLHKDTTKITEMRDMIDTVEQENVLLKSRISSLQEVSHNHVVTPTQSENLNKCSLCQRNMDLLQNINEERQEFISQKKVLEEKLETCMKKLSLAESALNAKNKRQTDEELKTLQREYNASLITIKDLNIQLEKQMYNLKQLESQNASIIKENHSTKTKLLVMETKFKEEAVKNEMEHIFKTTVNKTIEEPDFVANSELQTNYQILQRKLGDEIEKYEDLKTNWEKLSEETIMMRAQLTTEKENLISEIKIIKHKLGEMESIRKERTEFAKKLKEANIKIMDLETKSKAKEYIEQEKLILKNKLAEKDKAFELLKSENEMNIDLLSQMKKENEDLNKKLSDFNRIEQAQSSLNGHNAILEEQLRIHKEKLKNSESQLRSQISTMKLRYEQQIKILGAEITSIKRQCEKFKKDRDSFKQVIEMTKRPTVEVESKNLQKECLEVSEINKDLYKKQNIQYIEQKMSGLEDKLMEAKLEATQLKTQLVSERSANEIKLSELKSKLNELEEERVIGSGRTKIPGLKTKLQLSWQKEREEQQRLLQETSTLARDLRQTLFEVERERDKERLELKRRIELMKRSNEEELDEGRKKIAELQCDLLELRDVHAKIRTTNEKLRKERDKNEKELSKRRLDKENSDRKLSELLRTVEDVINIPEHNIAEHISRLAEVSKGLRVYLFSTQTNETPNKPRRVHLRKTLSQEDESTFEIISGFRKLGNKTLINRKEQAIRKSFSLDASLNNNIKNWYEEEGSMSSIQSFNSDVVGYALDGSLDSRLSGGSTQSDLPKVMRKKKSFIGKLRNFAKKNSETELSLQESDSEISITNERHSKKHIKGRLSDIFRKSGSIPKSSSSEILLGENAPVAVTVVDEKISEESSENRVEKSYVPRNKSKPPTGHSTTVISNHKIIKP